MLHYYFNASARGSTMCCFCKKRLPRKRGEGLKRFDTWKPFVIRNGTFAHLLLFHFHKITSPPTEFCLQHAKNNFDPVDEKPEGSNHGDNCSLKYLQTRPRASGNRGAGNSRTLGTYWTGSFEHFMSTAREGSCSWRSFSLLFHVSASS